MSRLVRWLHQPKEDQCRTLRLLDLVLCKGVDQALLSLHNSLTIDSSTSTIRLAHATWADYGAIPHSLRMAHKAQDVCKYRLIRQPPLAPMAICHAAITLPTRLL